MSIPKIKTAQAHILELAGLSSVKDLKFIAKKYNSRNDALAQAAKRKDDEFYTLKETADLIYDSYMQNLRGKRIYCPCDNENSSFVISAKERGLDIRWCSADFRNIRSGIFDEFKEQKDDYANADVIITNPPFSLIRQFYEMHCKEKDYIILAPITAIYKDIFLEQWIGGRLHSCSHKPKYFTNELGQTISAAVHIISSFRECKSEVKKINAEKIEFEHGGEKYINRDQLADIDLDECGNIAVPITIVLKDYGAISRTHEFAGATKKIKNRFARILLRRSK